MIGDEDLFRKHHRAAWYYRFPFLRPRRAWDHGDGGQTKGYHMIIDIDVDWLALAECGVRSIVVSSSCCSAAGFAPKITDNLFGGNPLFASRQIFVFLPANYLLVFPPFCNLSSHFPPFSSVPVSLSSPTLPHAGMVGSVIYSSATLQRRAIRQDYRLSRIPSTQHQHKLQ